jgi:hypothetical protein
MITLLIDADACPVKQEAYRVAERHALKGAALKVFSNSPDRRAIGESNPGTERGAWPGPQGLT